MALGGSVALPPARGAAGSLDLRNPVALQGVEQVHLRVSRYTSTLSLRSCLVFQGFLAWLPLQSLAVKKYLFLVQILGGEKLFNLLKSAGEIFLKGLRGAKNFSNAFRIVFRIFFRVFETVFRIDLKVFRGQFRSADMPP